MRRIARFHPFLILLVVGLAIMGLSQVVRLDYDQGVIGFAWFILTMILTIPFQIVGSVLTMLAGDGALPNFLAVTVTAILLIGCDVALYQWSKR